jgi:uncharacterized protein
MVFFMKAGDIQLGLAESNRWWRAGDWQAADPDLRRAKLAPFHYRSGALTELASGGLYVLRGPRRVGKSTEIKYAIADLIAGGVPPRNNIHAAVDGWRAADLRTLVTSARTTFLAGVTGTRYWFVDEISSVIGDWPNTIKNLRDNDPDFAADTVVLTGSSAARLHEVRKALAGRRGLVARSDLAGTDLRPIVSVLLPYLNDLVRHQERSMSTHRCSTTAMPPARRSTSSVGA